MNIVAIHGVEHKGSTYHIAKMVIHNLNADQITEFFLPKDMPHFCKGCGACFTKGEEFNAPVWFKTGDNGRLSASTGDQQKDDLSIL